MQIISGFLTWWARLFPVDYKTYLGSARWKRKARRARERAGYRCQLCYSADWPLEAHHRTYERLGYELPGDLTVLCGSCHRKHHGRKRP